LNEVLSREDKVSVEKSDFVVVLAIVFVEFVVLINHGKKKIC